MIAFSVYQDSTLKLEFVLPFLLNLCNCHPIAKQPVLSTPTYVLSVLVAIILAMEFARKSRLPFPTVGAIIFLLASAASVSQDLLLSMLSASQHKATLEEVVQEVQEQVVHHHLQLPPQHPPQLQPQLQPQPRAVHQVLLRQDQPQEFSVTPTALDIKTTYAQVAQTDTTLEITTSASQSTLSARTISAMEPAPLAILDISLVEELASLLVKTRTPSAKPPTLEESVPVAMPGISTTKLPKPASHSILSVKPQTWPMEPVSPASLATPFAEADAKSPSKTPTASSSMPLKPTASNAQLGSTPVPAENASRSIPSARQPI